MCAFDAKELERVLEGEGEKANVGSAGFGTGAGSALSKSGGSLSGRTSSILVCHEYPWNISIARPASSAVASSTVP